MSSRGVSGLPATPIAATEPQAQPAPAEPREEVTPPREPEDAHESRGPVPDPQHLVTAAREHLRELLGKEADSVTGLEPSDDGWLVTLEVVEVSRIPASTGLMFRPELAPKKE